MTLPSLTPASALFCAALAALATVAADSAPAAPKTYPVRTWTSVSGNTLEGTFLKEEDGKVFLSLTDGRQVATARDKLSPLDLAWIDQTLNPAAAAQTRTFGQATQLEKNKMEHHRKVRRLILKTYTQLTNNERDDKTLAFLQRDATSMYGWSYVSADFYLTPSGRKGKIKEMTFLPQRPVPLREAVQMVRDKFVLTLPDPVLVKQVSADGDTFWEIQSPPDYVSRIRLLADEQPETIRRFDFTFPPPAK